METIATKKHMIRMCRLFSLLLSLLFVLAMVSGPVKAAEKNVDVVKVGYYENEVFEEGARQGAIKRGYAYEYYLKLSEYTGWKYEYVYGEYGDLYQMLLDGEIDLLAGLAWKEDREDLIGYPDAAMGDETYCLVKHDTDKDVISEPADLSGKTIGVLDSAMKDVLQKFLEKHQITATVKPYKDYEALFEDFDSGEVDVLAAEGDGAYGREHAEVLFPFGESDYYLCVNKDRQDILKELNAAQTMLAADEPNYLYSLKAKYYPVTFSARAFSAAEKEWLKQNDSLHIGYLEHYLPYSDTDEQGNAMGIVKDLSTEILNQLGITDLNLTYSGYENYEEMIEAISSGEIDVAFPVGGGLYFSEENGIYQSTPVASSSTELIFEGEYSESKIEDFAVNENNQMQYYYVKTNFPDAKITMYSSIYDCLDAVKEGKAGCTTLNGLRANDILKNSKYKTLSMTQLSRNDDRCYGVEIGNEGLLKILNRGISVVGTDYAQSIAYRYTGELYTYTIGDMIQDHIGAFILALLAVAALIFAFLSRDIRRTKKEVLEKEAARIELQEKNRALADSKTALAEALAEAEQANHAKTTFLNNMSHDIRTPMNAIVGFTDLALSHAGSEEEVREDLNRIAVSSQNLLALINDVLDMSRIESGKLIMEEEDVHLPDVIDGIKTIIRSDVLTKDLRLEIDTDGIVHEDIVTDKVRLNQVLLNIFSNAIKFTPEGGEIGMTVTEKPSDSEDVAEYEFTIKDSGIGMSEEFQKTIFDEFTRERNSTVSGIQGTGLGMAITKSIVEKMGGSISVKSEEGKGSEFFIVIPFRISTVPVDGSGNKKTGMGPDAYDFTGKRVLLAEDNEMNQIIATALLEKAGFEVEIAADGQEAVDKVRDASDGYYDIILMDIQMPVMDGYEATGQIRALGDPAKAAIPIVAVTANAFEEDRKSAMEMGMDGHLAKPYDVPKLMDTMQRLLCSEQ